MTFQEYLKIINYLLVEAIGKGRKFTEDGFPIFAESEFYSDEITTEIIPYDHRNNCKNKGDAIVCFYEHDLLLSRKISQKKLSLLIKNVKEFKAFIGYDLSIFTDYLTSFQNFFILFNLMIDELLVSSGCKLIPNLRCGEDLGKIYFDLFLNSKNVACGTLGSSKYLSDKSENKRIILNYSDKHKNQKIILYGRLEIKANNIVRIKPFYRKEKRYGQK